MADDDSGDDTDPDDPFDTFDPDERRDRGSDPFEDLSDGRSAGESGSGTDRSSQSQSQSQSRSPSDSDAADAEGGPDRGDDPFAHLNGQDRDAGTRTDPDDRADRTTDVDIPVGDPFADTDQGGDASSEPGPEAFEQAGVDGVDPDDVWARLAGGGTDPDAVAEDEEVEVSKHAYCEGCEFFSSPPDVHCTHDGTRILEFVDMDTVRVVNCPVVAERRQLGREE